MGISSSISRNIRQERDLGEQLEEHRELLNNPLVHLKTVKKTVRVPEGASLAGTTLERVDVTTAISKMHSIEIPILTVNLKRDPKQSAFFLFKTFFKRNIFIILPLKQSLTGCLMLTAKAAHWFLRKTTLTESPMSYLSIWCGKNTEHSRFKRSRS